MVRNIVGTLVDIASRRVALEEVRSLFDAKDRRRAGAAAPPQGLFLVRVDYPAIPFAIAENAAYF